MQKELEEWVNKSPVITGAGTIGSYFAKKISNLNPIILEEHKKIGSPVHCTGLISKRILDLVDIPSKTILNTIKRARIYSPDGNFCEIGDNNPRAFVFDRQMLDEYLSKELEISNEKYISHEVSNGIVNVKTSKRKIKTKLMVDCSGPSSKTFGSGKFLVGVQYRMKMKHERDFVELHFGNKICPGFFSWIVPENEEICRIGLATKENPLFYMKRFCKKFKGKILEKQGGIIPMETKKFYSNNIIAIGDSAGQTKKTTGGGVVTGMLSADIAADAVNRAYEVDNFASEFFFVNYQVPWSFGVGKQISVHDRLRNALNRLSDSELNTVINLLKENTELINKYGDMDFPLSMILKLIKPKNLSVLFNLFLKSM